MNHAATFFFLVSGAAFALEPLTPREKMLLDRIEKLEQRLAALEARAGVSPAPAAASPEPLPVPQTKFTPASLALEVVRRDHINANGRHGYNFHRPFTGTNRGGLCASWKRFAINQAGIA